MQDFTSIVLALLKGETLGIIGGIVFFSSWVLQAQESRRAGSPTVSARFFVLRIIASALLSVEAVRTGSFSIFSVMFATMMLMIYNLWLSKRTKRT